MNVKICGITNMDDALCACAAGADFLGFVFYPGSPRYVPPARARALIGRLRAERALERTRTVGLCVQLVPAELDAVARAADVDCLQVYGTYVPQDLAQVNAALFKAIRPVSPQAAAHEADRYAALAPPSGPALLLDAFEAGTWGGTGQRADWDLAAQVRARHPRTMLAGGLTPDNVCAAIRQVRPWGVDVSSGVETAPGRKEPAAVRAFVARARRAARTGAD